MDYAEQALHGEQVEAMLAALQRRILHSCQRADLAIAPRDFIDLAHYRHNDSEANYAPYPYLAQLAERLFGAQGGGNALICGEQTLTYRELGQRIATAIANLQNRGVQPGNVVALYLPRSPEQIILSLACALQGVIWVPVDINSPPERTAYLLENCRPTLVVHGGDLETPIGVTPATLLAPTDRTPALPDEQTLVERSASQAASYYLYTSGTTGKPKCVVLNNRATANVVHQTQQRWAVTADDVFISVTPPHHDMSMFDLFGSLCAGATLVLPAPHQEKDAISWNQLVEKHRVTLWCSVPAILEMLLTCKTADSLRSLRLVAQGGDYIKPATVQTLRTLRPDLALFSLGGPTETTIWSIWHPIAPQEAPCLTAARCRPTATSSAMTTAATARPAWSAASIPPGSTWRWATWSRGAEAARFRYPRRAGWATAARFRTGDQGYYRADGNIMFATRVNGYVKIRGVRVSLPEIEDVLRRHPAIQDMVVVDYPSGENNEAALGALYLTRDGTPCRCPRSAPSPPAICPVPIFRHALSMPRRCRCPPTAKPTAIASVPT